jgi:gamma-glutamylaminecyclotransferase
MRMLFVYGTLKRGHRLHAYLEMARFVGEASTGPGYALYRIEWFPAMVADPEAAGVSGELYEVDDELLARLDEVESAPYVFRRAPITLQTSDGMSEVEAYLYQRPVARLTRIESGSWSD